MNPSQKSVLSIVSLQVQTSFQSVPLGASCVVSSVRADRDLASLLDIRLAEFSFEETQLAGLSVLDAGTVLSHRIAADNPRFAGFSVYAWNRLVFEDTARKLKELVPGIVVFAGGPEVTASPASFGNNFDYLVCGEGEEGARSLLRALLEGTKIPEAIMSHKRFSSTDFASLPSPWLDGTADSCIAAKECHGALWELARGCPYSCAYCYESKGEKKVREIPLERLEKELEHFVETGIERVFVLDPTYNANRDRAVSLLRLIEKKAGEIHFNFEVRAEQLDREMIQAFAKIPCSLQIGLQSTNQEALKLVNRPCDISLFAKKIGLLNDAGVVFGLDLMYGLPGDTLSSFRSSLDYAIGLYPNNLEIFRLAVLPGTSLADNAESLSLKYGAFPPYLVESTPKFPQADLERAGLLARACDVFYTQGRAVTWFLSSLHPLKLKASQFLQDFARFLGDPATRSRFDFLSGFPADSVAELDQADAETLQIDFLKIKYAEKDKGYLLPALCDTIRLNGALTRALAEGDATELSLSYHPDDLLSPDAMDLEYFSDSAYMENCTVRVFNGKDGPDIEVK